MEEKQPGGAGKKATVKTKKRRPRRRRVVIAALVLLLAAAAVLALVFRDRLSGDGLKGLFATPENTVETAEVFSYENGSGQTFAPAGDGLAVASSSAIQLLDAGGKAVVKEITTLGTPAVTASKTGSLFFDVGGTVCKNASFDGTVTDIALSGDIISAAMNSSGWFTVITEESGYKGLVQVYSPSCELVYEWWAGSAYALKALVSPDNKSLAVLCVGTDGGALRFFSLSSETEKASVSFEGDLLFDFYYMNSSRVCAISENAVYFADPNGGLKGSYDLGGQYLGCYSFGSTEFAAVCVSPYRSGAGGTVITLDAEGKPLGSAMTERDINGISANGKDLCVMTSGDISLYSGTMELKNTAERLMTARTAHLRSGGDILLLYAYSAEVFAF